MSTKRRIIYAVSLILLGIVCLAYTQASWNSAQALTLAPKIRVEDNTLHVEGLNPAGSYMVLAQSGQESKFRGLLLVPGKTNYDIPLSITEPGANYYVVQLAVVISTRCQPGFCPPIRCPGCDFVMDRSGSGRL